MKILQIPTGPIQENCYLVYNEKHLLIIDPGAEPEKIIETITDTKARPAAILLTHTHYDHIGAVDPLREFYEIPVYVSPLEADWLQNPQMNLSGLGRHDDIENITAGPADEYFELQEYEIADLSFKVVATPGHSIGSVSFIFPDFVVSGDALFRGSIGRTDLPTGNLQQLLESIQTQLFTLPEEFPVYPGHGEATTIEREKRLNPFFNN